MRSYKTAFMSIALCGLAALGACSAKNPQQGKQVGQAWSQRPGKNAGDSQRTAQQDVAIGKRDSKSGDVIAYVNNRPIERARIVDLLLAGHGCGMLEQVVVLERAQTSAAEQGISLGKADVNREYDRALKRLVTTVEPANEDSFDRDSAEATLETILSRRNISRDEYMLGITRNAYLRALIEKNLELTDEQLHEEYDRLFGERVEIRHIQLGSLRDAQAVRALLARGEDFAEVARERSVNAGTAADGGLLRPFSANDEDVPESMRQTAFALAEGDISPPFRADEWYHIIRLERRIPAEKASFESLRPELERRMRDRYVEPAMQTLYRTLFDQADIRIIDPILKKEFERKHPNRADG